MSFRGHRQGDAPVSTGLIAICVVIWLIQHVIPSVTSALMMVPSLGYEQPWRFLTSAFVHSPTGLTHIVFNMLTLWVIGRFLEPILGGARFLSIYLLSALGGSTLFVLLAFPASAPGRISSWNTAAVGASGAIFGLFGAYLILAIASKQSVTPLLTLLFLNIIIAFLVPGIAWTAHIGGFVTGAAATAAVFWADRRSRGSRSLRLWGGQGLILVILIIVVAVKYALI